MMRLIIPILCLMLLPLPAWSRALEVFPRAIRMELKAVGLEQFQSTQDFLHIRIQTRLLKGSRWRLWIQPVVPPESFGKIFRAEALSWTARPPFISHSLFPNEKAIVGQGRIDGRTVEGRLIWRAGNGAQAAGEYRGRVMLILEELP